MYKCSELSTLLSFQKRVAVLPSSPNTMLKLRKYCSYQFFTFVSVVGGGQIGGGVFASGVCGKALIGSFSTRVFETRTATGREHFACQDSGISQNILLTIPNGGKIPNNISGLCEVKAKGKTAGFRLPSASQTRFKFYTRGNCSGFVTNPKRFSTNLVPRVSHLIAPSERGETLAHAGPVPLCQLKHQGGVLCNQAICRVERYRISRCAATDIARDV